MAFMQGDPIRLYWIAKELERLGYKRSIKDYGCGMHIYLIAKSDATYCFAYTLSLYGYDWGEMCQDKESFLNIAKNQLQLF